MNHLTRRGFGRGLAALTLASTAPHSRALGVTSARPRPLGFPDGFLWGCATSAYQIEGGAQADGRGPSIWDTFAHSPGKTHAGDTGDVEDDSYHRYAEDVALLKGLGAKAYRFSISWPRVFPRGRGQANPAGLAYYDRLVDELLKHGVAPWPTLFHWDLPQALAGGWQARDTAYALAELCGLRCTTSVRPRESLHDHQRIRVLHGPQLRQRPVHPGLKLGEAELSQVRHHAVLAHGLAVQSIRGHARGAVQVGLADNPTNYIPVIDAPEHIAAARSAQREENAPFLTVVLDGRYTDDYLERLGGNAPQVQAGDMAIIGSAVDFVGLNVYEPEYVAAADAPGGYRVIKKPAYQGTLRCCDMGDPLIQFLGEGHALAFGSGYVPWEQRLSYSVAEDGKLAFRGDAHRNPEVNGEVFSDAYFYTYGDALYMVRAADAQSEPDLAVDRGTPWPFKSVSDESVPDHLTPSLPR